MQKYSKSNSEVTIWQRADLDKKTAIKRCVILECNFNAADFWLNHKAKLCAEKNTYIFKLHYGRNVASIIKKP